MGVFDIFKKTKEKSDGFAKVYNKAELLQIKRHTEIIDESLEILNKTLHPITYFSRYDLVIENARILYGICPNSMVGERSKTIIDNMPKEKEMAVKNFIQRCYDAGRLPYVKNEFEQLKDKMSDKNLRFYELLLERHYADFQGELFKFCSVKFDNIDKTYDYIVDNNIDVNIDDSVIVPFGRENVLKTGRVVSINSFKASQAPYPIEKMKKIIRTN